MTSVCLAVIPETGGQATQQVLGDVIRDNVQAIQFEGESLFTLHALLLSIYLLS